MGTKSLRKKKRKPSSRQLRKQALELWKEVVRKRAGEVCEVCNKSHAKLNCHHVITRHDTRFRYCLDNGVLLCPTCHKFGPKSAHNNPVWFIAIWMLEKRKEQLINLLKKIDEPTTKIDYPKLIEELSLKLTIDKDK